MKLSGEKAPARRRRLLATVAIPSLFLMAGCGSSGGGGSDGANPAASPLQIGTLGIGTTSWSMNTTPMGTTSWTIGTTSWPIGTAHLGTTSWTVGTSWTAETLPPAAKASGGIGQAAVLLRDGRLALAVRSAGGEHGGDGSVAPAGYVQVGSAADWADVAVGDGYTLALKADGSLWGWGRNDYGQLTLDRTAVSKTDVPVQGSGMEWASLRGGAYHAVGFKTDGSAWAWGYNSYGGLGVGSPAYAVAEPQPLGTGWADISAGLTGFGLGIRTDGSLWAWGYNYYGQCGFGNHFQSFSPARVGTDSDWAAVSAGSAHSLALKSDGSLWGWGDVSSGQAGNTPNPLVPGRIGADTDWVAIAAGGSRSYALKRDGTIWGLGQGLGPNGTPTAVPVQVSTNGEYVSIIAVPRLMGIKADGTVEAF